MPFVFTEIGESVARNPRAAASHLRALLRGAHGNVTTLARELGVSARTLWRWFGKLEDAGCSVRKHVRKAGRPRAAAAAG